MRAWALQHPCKSDMQVHTHTCVFSNGLPNKISFAVEKAVQDVDPPAEHNRTLNSPTIDTPAGRTLISNKSKPRQPTRFPKKIRKIWGISDLRSAGVCRPIFTPTLKRWKNQKRRKNIKTHGEPVIYNFRSPNTRNVYL